jgi:hypothetical protein
MEDRVVLIRVRRLLRCIILPLQADKLSTILSMSSWNAAFGSLPVERGIPRYLIRNSMIGHGNRCWTSATWSASHWIGMTWHLAMLHPRPEALSKSSKMASVSCRSPCIGLRKSTTSSTYTKTLKVMCRGGNYCSSNQESALRNKPLSTSITNKKSIGNKGPPCCNPLACHMQLTCAPFS